MHVRLAEHLSMHILRYEPVSLQGKVRYWGLCSCSRGRCTFGRARGFGGRDATNQRMQRILPAHLELIVALVLSSHFCN